MMRLLRQLGAAIAHPGLLFLVALVGLWEVAKAAGWISTNMVPRPSETIAATVSLIGSGALVEALLHTVMACLIGWFLACALGIFLGIAIGISTRLHFFTSTSVEVLRAVPAIALLPPAILTFGFSMSMELFLIAFAALWPILINTISGVKSVPVQLIETGRTLKLDSIRVLRKIIVPAALPKIIVGIRVSLGLSLVLAVAAEMVGNPAGLGRGLVASQEALRPNEMMSYFLVIGILGVALNSALTLAVRLTIRNEAFANQGS